MTSVDDVEKRNTEYTVLGAMLNGDEAARKGIAHTKEEWFSPGHHQIIRRTIESNLKEGISVNHESVLASLNGDRSAFNDEGGADIYLANLFAKSTTGESIVFYCEKLKDICTRQMAKSRRNKAARAALRTPDDEKKWLEVRRALDNPDLEETHKDEFHGSKDVVAHPVDQTYLIKRVLPEKGIVQIFGSPSVGKSFLAIDIACHVALGRPWCGFKTKQVPVLYIAAEGQGGITLRLKAWCQRHGIIPENDLLKLKLDPVGLTVPGAATALANRIKALPKPPRLIILDTLAANFGPGDENTTRDMNMAMNALKELAGDGLVMCIHHSGHLDKTRGRGSSVALATFDVDLMVTRDDPHGPIKLEHKKGREIEPMDPLYFGLERQILPETDEDGDPLNSAVIVPADGYVEQSNRKDRVVGQIRAALAGGPLTIRQLRQAVNAKYEFINQVKFQMLEQGSLRLIQGPRNSQSLALVDTPPKEAE